jgi:hypothetical protein
MQLGEEGLAASGLGEAWPGQGHGKGAASPARRGLAVGNQRPRGARMSSMGGFGAGEGDLDASGPSAVLWRQVAGRHRRPGGRRPLPFNGTEQGRGEKREGGREKKARQIKFSQNFE